jgi:hypothetical protein
MSGESAMETIAQWIGKAEALWQSGAQAERFLDYTSSYRPGIRR